MFTILFVEPNPLDTFLLAAIILRIFLQNTIRLKEKKVPFFDGSCR